MTGGLTDRLRRIKHVALDMDGTIYLSDTLFPYTIPFLARLERLGITYSFLTNNPTKNRRDYVAKLRRLGIPVQPEQMYTAVETTVGYIKSRMAGVRRLYILGTPSMVSEFEAAGFESVDENPEAVVVSFDTTLVYERLCKAAWYIGRGLPYVATNPDFVCPTDQPTVLVDCGSICACLEKATGRKPDAVMGKPDPQILYTIASDRGLDIASVAMVGDRIYTDVASGINAGALSVLVLSGETTLEKARESQVKPDLITENIEEFGLLLEHNMKQNV